MNQLKALVDESIVNVRSDSWSNLLVVYCEKKNRSFYYQFILLLGVGNFFFMYKILYEATHSKSERYNNV